MSTTDRPRPRTARSRPPPRSQARPANGHRTPHSTRRIVSTPTRAHRRIEHLSLPSPPISAITARTSLPRLAPSAQHRPLAAHRPRPPSPTYIPRRSHAPPRAATLPTSRPRPPPPARPPAAASPPALRPASIPPYRHPAHVPLHSCFLALLPMHCALHPCPCTAPCADAHALHACPLPPRPRAALCVLAMRRALAPRRGRRPTRPGTWRPGGNRPLDGDATIRSRLVARPIARSRSRGAVVCGRAAGRRAPLAVRCAWCVVRCALCVALRGAPCVVHPAPRTPPSRRRAAPPPRRATLRRRPEFLWRGRDAHPVPCPMEAGGRWPAGRCARHASRRAPPPAHSLRPQPTPC